MRFHLTWVLLCGAALIGAGCDDQPKREVVTVFSAASTVDAMTQAVEIAAVNAGVIITSGPSSTLATQIIQGGPADLFLGANVEWADEVARQRTVVARRNLLGNRLVVIVPRDSSIDVSSPADLAAEQIARFALADDAAVPVGIYGRRALEAWGVWSALEPRIVTASDVRHALALVASGAADAGIVYATDAALSKDVRVVMEVSPEVAGPIVYPLLLLTESPAARRLFDRLSSAEAAAIFEHHGFELLAP